MNNKRYNKMGLRDLLGIRGRKDQASSSASTHNEQLDEIVPAPTQHQKQQLVPSSSSSSSSSDTLLAQQGGFGTTSSSMALAQQRQLSNNNNNNSMPYNPYTGLGGPFDAGMSQKLYSLSTTPEYLFDEERQMRTRSWSENLTYLTGVGYLGGSVAGGGIGLYKGLQTPREAIGIDSTKLKVNRVLNAVSHRGRTFGNAWGAVGLFYAGLESATMIYTEHRYDPACSVFAGAGAGVLYKSMNGPRAMAVYGVGGGVLSALNQIAQMTILAR